MLAPVSISKYLIHHVNWIKVVCSKLFIVGSLGVGIQYQGSQESICEPWALTLITTLKGGDLWLIIFLNFISCLKSFTLSILLCVSLLLGHLVNFELAGTNKISYSFLWFSSPCHVLYQYSSTYFPHFLHSNTISAKFLASILYTSFQIHTIGMFLVFWTL